MENKGDYKQVDKFIVSDKLIGKGAFGKVFRGFFKNDHSTIVAVKVISIEKIGKSPQFIEHIRREIDILGKLNHPNIVKMYSVARTPRNLYIFLEYCKNGDLKDLLKRNGGFLSESEANKYFKQICNGFKVLYEQSIIHRDIKPANILLDENEAKISDFGFARFVIDSGMESLCNFTTIGTPLYMSPQILANEQFSSKCDIWSLAMMYFEMLYGKTPWNGNSPNQLLNNINAIKLSFPAKPTRSRGAKNILSMMLEPIDAKRCSWLEIFEHPLLVNKSTKPVKKEDFNLSNDELQNQAIMMKSYLEVNRVMDDKKENKVKQFFEENKMEVEENNTPKSTNDAKKEKVVYQDKQYSEVIALQNESTAARNNLLMIDSFFVFQRNISTFLAYTGNSFYQILHVRVKDGGSLSYEMYYITFFLLQKFNLILLSSTIKLLKEEMPNNFSGKDWQNYKASNFYLDTIKILSDEYEFILSNFDQMALKIENFLSNSSKQKVYSEEETAIIERFLTLMNKDFSINADFEKFFKEYLSDTFPFFFVLQFLQYPVDFK